MYKLISTSILVLLATSSVVESVQLSVNLDHDMSRPTFGLQGPSSSNINYDEKNGLNLKGTVNDLLGPPIKIAHGLKNIITGGNMGMIGNGLKGGSAILGFDANMLESAGGAGMMKGGVLMGQPAGQQQAAKNVAGPPGRKVSSIIELPVKIVALKDIAAGSAIKGLGQVKADEADATKTKGEQMVTSGNSLKSEGMSQVVQGAQEGMQNIGNMFHQTANNIGSAMRLLPIMLDLPMPPVTQQQEQQHETKSDTHGKSAQSSSGLTGGSLFGGLGSGGLSSLLPTLPSGGDLLGQNSKTPGYAAVLNSTSPFANLLSNHNLNPILFPMMGGGGFGGLGGPIQQSTASKQPFSNSGLGGLFGGNEMTATYNLLPGLRMTETSSSSLPNFSNMASLSGGQKQSSKTTEQVTQQVVQQQQQQQQQPEQQPQQQQQQQQQVSNKSD